MLDDCGWRRRWGRLDNSGLIVCGVAMVAWHIGGAAAAAECTWLIRRWRWGRRHEDGASTASGICKRNLPLVPVVIAVNRCT
jgi:hypothetical protein